MACEVAFQRELDRINQEIDVERAIADASEDLQIYELLDKAAARGAEYSQGYQDGFWAGRELLLQRTDAVTTAIHQKHDELLKRWDWPE